MKRFDLMFGVNVRGTFVCSQACLPYLKQSANAGRNPHILNLSPPLNMKAALVRTARRLHDGEVRHEHVRARHGGGVPADGIGVNALWPRTVIATAALQMIPAANPEHGRKPEIMADAAHAILTRDAARVHRQLLHRR